MQGAQLMSLVLQLQGGQQQLQGGQQQLQQQVQRLASQRFNTTRYSSASVLGQEMIEKAIKRDPVTISDADREEAGRWLARAKSKDARLYQAWVAATSHDSKLPEAGGTQDVLSRMLPFQPAAAGTQRPLQLYDTHDRASVCGDLRPDMVCSTASAMVPSCAAAVLELKGQTQPFNSPANFHQVCVRVRRLAEGVGGGGAGSITNEATLHSAPWDWLHAGGVVRCCNLSSTARGGPRSGASGVDGPEAHPAAADEARIRRFL